MHFQLGSNVFSAKTRTVGRGGYYPNGSQRLAQGRDSREEITQHAGTVDLERQILDDFSLCAGPFHATLRSMKSPLLLFAALTVSAVSTWAQVPSTPNVRIEVQMVTMALEKGLPLIPNLRDAGSIDGAFSQIQKMIAAGDATLVAWPEVVTKSGQRAVTEDIQEVRYPTKFDGAQPTKIAGSETEPAKDSAPPQPARGGAPVPTAFETRNIGATLEVEPVLGPDGKTIDLNIVPQSVRLLEFIAVASGRDSNGHDWKIEQPRFYTAKTTTSLSVVAGQRVLLAEFRGPAGSEQIEFFILKAEVTGAIGAKSN